GSHSIAITDRGSWLRGRIVYRDGRPAGIADAEIAPMLGLDGKPLAARGWYDAESLAERDGMLYVGIERVEQIVRFDYRRDGLLARGQPIKVPPDFKTSRVSRRGRGRCAGGGLDRDTGAQSRPRRQFARICAW